MVRGGADSPALPVELWGKVASYLTLRESCMLASTCRALWTMDLLSVKLIEWGNTAAQGGADRARCIAAAQHGV